MMKVLKHFFLNNVNWLVNNAVNKGNYSLLQYSFPLPIYNFEPPWFSAMANGLALQVLIKAHEITQDLKYLTAAKSLLNAFFIEVKYEGVIYKDSSNEWWYQEYASNDKNAKISRVLNGMLFTVLGIYDYFEYTGDPDAEKESDLSSGELCDYYGGEWEDGGAYDFKTDDEDKADEFLDDVQKIE